LLITSSILNDTITFTKGNGSTYSLTVNNVSTSSYASNADLLDGRDSTTFAGTGSNTFNGNQIITGTLNVSSTISGTTALFTTITSSAITSSTLLSTNITGTYAQLLNLSGTTAQYTTISGSQITGSEIKTTTLSASYISASQIALTEYLDFNTAGTTPTYRQGRLYYNVDTQDPAYYTTVTNVAVNVGQQVVVKVKNSSGVSIAKGKLVHIVGGVGANPLIATASWENDNNSANTLGMTMNSMNQNDFGYVLLNGIITDVNTQGFTAGQILYLSSSGNYTGNKPQAPLHAVKVGEVVTVQQNNGVIFVNISNGQEIEELHDVRITSASSGDLLTYSSYNGTPVWVNTKTLSGSYVITGSLTISSSATFTNIGPAIFSGTINTNNILSGTTAQFTTITATSITGSITTASYAQNADLFDNRDSTTFAGTGSNTFTGIQNFNQNITGTHAYFSGDIVINGTASIGMLETRNQQSLIVGDKYIVIMSGATDHTTLDGSGILYGSGATGPTVDENGSNAYLRYRNSYDAVEAFPGFRVTGSLAVTNNSTFTTVSGTVARFTELTASLISGTITNALYSSNADLLDGRDSTSFAGLTGNTFSGNQIITGTLNVSNTISGTTALFTQITGNLFGTASYATTAGAVAGAPLLSANNTFTGINTFNTYYITGSITGSDAKFTSVSGTHVGSGTGLTSIPNAALVNSSVTIGTTAISLGSSVTTIQGVSVLTGSTITGSTALFTNTTSTTSIIGTGLYASNTTTTVVGNNAIYNVATASYDGMFIDYTARSGSNARAGQIMAIWSGSSVNYTETTTNDFGSTTGLAMAVVINGTNMQLSASASTANWTVKTIIRTI
jgi:hypothetical protein